MTDEPQSDPIEVPQSASRKPERDDAHDAVVEIDAALHIGSAVDAAALDIDPVLDKFQILEKIAAGGIGIVYKARDTALAGKLVALKVLKSDTKDAQNMVRFQNEARILVRLSHPNIATVYDFGVSKNGEPFMAIEFIDGVTLREVLSEKERLPLEETLRIAVQVCDALGYAHSKGVVHRDVQPGNIILTAGGIGKRTVKLIDFGIAKTEEGTSSAHLTRHGQWIGSPLYISPEQCSSQPVTPRSDMYSLGCVLFHCLTGNPPFRGATAFDTIKCHIEEPAPPLPDEFPAELAVIVARLLEKDPQRRYDSMEKIGRRLGRILYGTAPESPDTEESPDTVPTSSLNEIKDSKGNATKMLLVLSALFVPAIIFLAITLGDWLSRDNGALVPENSTAVEVLTNSLKKGERDFKLEESKLTDDQLAVFEPYHDLSRIDLAGSAITDHGLKHLVATNVDRLGLNGTLVKDLPYLPDKERLTILELRGTKVTDETMRRLQGCKKLAVLDVAETKVTLKGLELLSSLPLQELNVSKMNRSDSARLAEIFPFCSINRKDSFTDSVRKQTEVLLDKNRGQEAFSTCSYWRKVARQRHDYPLEVFCLTGMAYVNDQIGKTAEADPIWKEAIALGESKNCHKQMETTYDVCFKRMVALGRMDEAVEVAKNAIKNFENLNDNNFERAVFRLNRGAILAENKRPKEALKIIQETLDTLNEQIAEHRSSRHKTPWSQNDRLIHAQTEVILGEAFRHDGRFDLARQHIAQGITEIKELAPQGVDANFVAFTFVRAAEIELQDKNLRKSLEFNDKALNLLNKGARVVPAKVLEILKQRTQILHALGKHLEARQVEEKLEKLPH